jgi:hypothetical protein
VRVHPLDVDGRERSRELARDLDRYRDATAGDAGDERLIKVEHGDGLRQLAAGRGAITEERLDPRDDPHPVILRPGRARRSSAP